MVVTAAKRYSNLRRTIIDVLPTPSGKKEIISWQ